MTITLWIGAIWVGAYSPLIAKKIETNEARCFVDVENGVSAPEAKVLLKGAAYKVPALNFRLNLSEKDTENRPHTIRIFYIWEWLEYPSRGRRGGAWEDAGDIVECSSGEKSSIVIPAYTVIPKGWYSGEFANERKNTPRFDHMEVAFETKDCGAPRLLFDKKEIENFRKMTALVSLPCGGLPTYKFLRETPLAD